MAPKRPGDYTDKRYTKSHRYGEHAGIPLTVMDSMQVSTNRGGSGWRYSGARQKYVRNYTGSHGSRGFVRRNGKRYNTGPYSLLSNSSAAKHTNPSYPPAELKVDDTAPGALSIPTTGTFATTGAINNIAQGTNNATRIGSRICIKSIAYRMDFDINSAATTTAVRMILFWDRQPNTYSTGLVATDILASASYLSFNNPANSDRFVILRNVNLGLATGGPQTAFLEGYVKINMVSSYLNVTNEPTTGALGCLWLSDQATNTPTVNAQFRVRFSDC